MEIMEITNIEELSEKIKYFNISPKSPLRIIIEGTKPRPNEKDFAFLNDDFWDGDVPSDLSLKHDDYLYGEK
jgi:hypothetical protein